MEVGDADEIESALGFPLAAPEGVEAAYTVIGGSTGEAAFTVGEVECTLRAARTQDDISGLFMEMDGPAWKIAPRGKAPFPSRTARRRKTAAMTFTPGSWTTCNIAWYSTARQAP